MMIISLPVCRPFIHLTWIMYSICVLMCDAREMLVNEFETSLGFVVFIALSKVKQSNNH